MFFCSSSWQWQHPRICFSGASYVGSRAAAASLSMYGMHFEYSCFYSFWFSLWLKFVFGPASSAAFVTGEFQGQSFVMADLNTMQFLPASAFFYMCSFWKTICAPPLVRSFVHIYCACTTTNGTRYDRVPRLRISSAPSTYESCESQSLQGQKVETDCYR